MQFISYTLTLAAIAELASATQLLICSDSTTANYALDNALQGYYDSQSLRDVPRGRRQNADYNTDGATTSTTTPPWQ
jgi:hypothetical protein